MMVIDKAAAMLGVFIMLAAIYKFKAIIRQVILNESTIYSFSNEKKFLKEAFPSVCLMAFLIAAWIYIYMTGKSPIYDAFICISIVYILLRIISLFGLKGCLMESGIGFMGKRIPWSSVAAVRMKRGSVLIYYEDYRYIYVKKYKVMAFTGGEELYEFMAKKLSQAKSNIYKGQ